MASSWSGRTAARGPPPWRRNFSQLVVVCSMTAIVGATLQLNKLAVLDGAGREFAQTSYGSKTAFLVPYALFKAACNLLVGGLADRHGRKSIALAGSLVGLVPPVMVLAASGAGDGEGWPAFVGSAAFLGVHQGVTWTCCVLITMDLCGPNARGLASGLSETVGYTFIAIFAEAYGALERVSVTCAWDPADVPTSECLEASRGACDTPDDWVAECTGQCVCVGYAVAPFALQLALAAVGVGVAAAALRESRQAPSRAAADSDNATELSARPRDDRSSRDARIAAAAKTGAFVELEALEADDDALLERDASGEMSAEKENDFEASSDTRDFRAERLSVSFARATWGNRALAVVCVAGFCANFETGMAWGLLASWSRDGLGIGGARRDAFMASYSFLKGFSQLAAGIFSDRVGRRWPMSVGLLGGAASLLLAAFGAGYDGAYLSSETRGDTEEHALDARFKNLMASGVLLGLFTGLMYPVLAAAAADHAPGGALAGTVGTVRFWRDLGYAMGMPVAAIADASRPETALIFVACVMAAAGALVAVAYVEKHPHRA
jgi:MFS family permease